MEASSVGKKTLGEAITSPVVIVEELSPSTEARDRGEKFGFYKQSAALQEYVLISEDERRVEVRRRTNGGWSTLRCYDGPVRGTSLIPFAAAAVLATLATLTPRATLAFDRPESLDALLSVVAPDTKKACEDSGGVWVTLTDEEKKTVAAYCDLSPAITNTSWSSETESGMSWESVAARANSLARFYDGRLGTAKSAFVATRELTVGTTLADAIIARLAAANAADLKLKSADAQKRVAVREQALVAWRRTRVAITRVEEEWKKRAGAAKKP